MVKSKVNTSIEVAQLPTQNKLVRFNAIIKETNDSSLHKNK